MKKTSLALIFGLVLLVSCVNQITKEEAEQAALGFVIEKGKFYTTENTDTRPEFQVISSEQTTAGWLVTIRVLDPQTQKKAYLQAEVDNKGGVGRVLKGNQTNSTT
jgi:hypothetical protein